MRKIIVIALLSILIISSSAYTRSVVVNESTITVSSSDSAIYAVEKNLVVDVYLTEITTTFHKITRTLGSTIEDMNESIDFLHDVMESKSSKTSKTKTSFDKIDHNFSITNNSSEIIDQVKINDTFDSIDIDDLGIIYPGETKEMNIYISDLSNISKIEDENIIIEIIIECEDKMAVIKKEISLNVIKTSKIREVTEIIEIAPEIIDTIVDESN